MTPWTRCILVVIGAAFALLAALATMRLFEQRDFASYWRALDASALDQTFSEDLVADLPEPAQRYFRRAIKPGTPLASSVRLQLRERRRVISQASYEDSSATGIISPHRGFVWEGRRRSPWGFVARATASLDGERYERELFLGLVPLSSLPATSSQSLETQRLVAILLCPTALLPLNEPGRHDLQWEPLDATSARVLINDEGQRRSLELTIDEDGRLQRVSVPSMRLQATIVKDGAFDGYTIPTYMRIESPGEVREVFVDGAWFKY